MTTIEEMVSMISQERRDVYHAMDCSRLWKRAAKKWRTIADIYKIHQASEFERANAWRATATRRKELLRRGLKPMNSAEYKIWVEDVEKELADAVGSEG